MSAFIDASVIVAILSREADENSLMERVKGAGPGLCYSSVVVYEAAVSLARKIADERKADPRSLEDARATVVAFLRTISAEEVAISGAVADLAVDAASRFGKVVGHPARLNMGDCFAYACAKSQGVPLLFKGDDFSKTDIAIA